MSDDHDDHAAPPADPRLTAAAAAAAAEGCAEARLLMTRRSLLGVTAALFSTAVLPDFAHAEARGASQARLLVVVLRGGMDGINTMVPKLDPHYAAARRELAIPLEATLSLGSDFGLHPALSRLHTMFTEGEAAFVPAAAIPLRNRSHFECQDNLENGLPSNPSNPTGWLNRLLGTLPAGDVIRQRSGLEVGGAPLILRGPEPVLGWSPTWFSKIDTATQTRLRRPYRQLAPDLWGSLERGIAADTLALSAGAGNSPGVNALRRGFIGAARLMRADSGPRIAVLSVGGWDTHASQGGLTGEHASRLTALDEALQDLKTELAEVWAHTVVLCVTEFGRTVQTNGDRGTDHGIATTALLAGGAVRAGILGDWPGLAPNQLYEHGDLRPTVDLRAVFKGVLRDHLGVARSVLDRSVFPGSGDVAPLGRLIRDPVRRAEGRASAFVQPIDPRTVSPIALYRRQHGIDTEGRM